MKQGSARKAIYRKDYTPWPWLLEQVSLRFDIGDSGTRVTADLRLARADGNADEPLELCGRGLETLAVAVDGEVMPEDRYEADGETLTLRGVPDRFTLRTEVRIHPDQNTALEGLYASDGFLLTQCEAQGFRKITWFPDRPDVMAPYEVTIEADRARYPVLLSNGNLVGEGDAAYGRHWTRWQDPFPKPSYLFALVAGDLACVEDTFTTRSGREVTLRIYTEHGSEDRCGHAMESLQNAMRWDEERFGLEYDLDIYHVVVTHAFNMGAMENKSLNIFNSKYVLARPDTATDFDYQAIEGVVGHEYFHNWTGNRVTCRDWFQLTLKEGLTVFRDQEFSADMQSRAVKRIQDVRDLRTRQYPEDAGPMAHPIRPDHYIEINNFYTATVYEKGAAVIRMVHTLLGEDGFQAGMKLYFERHDGQAVTCDDFLAAMADANGADLSKFSRWYGQSGTPVVTVHGEHDAERAEYRLALSQRTPPTPDQPEKQPLVIPFGIGLLSPDGEEYPLQLADEDAPAGTSRVLVLDEAEQTFTFTGIPAAPVPSLLRDHSAPVRLDHEHERAELALLMAHDTDPFARWEAGQRLATEAIMDAVGQRSAGRELSLDEQLVAAFGALLDDHEADPALLAETMALPSELLLADEMDVVDVDGIHAARNHVRRALSERLWDAWKARYEALDDGRPYDKSAASIGRRSLKNVCLGYLAARPGGHDLARRQLESSDNMTDTLAALKALAWNRAEGADEALAAFERQWRDDALVMDKWFAIQAAAPGPHTLAKVRALAEHPAFSIRNPNKVRSLVGAFAMSNPTAFHGADGAGYAWVADLVIELNAINPQTASRIVSAFNRWRRYDQTRQTLMKHELKRISETDALSPDVFEIVSNALK